MSGTPSWASDLDSCTVQCLADAILEEGGCSDLSDTACFCEHEALLATTPNDSKEISSGIGPRARGTGSIVELGPNPPRPPGTLPGEQSLGYSSVVMELEGARAPRASPPPTGRPLSRDTRGAPGSEGLFPVVSTTYPAEASPSSVTAPVVISMAQEQPTSRSAEDLDRFLKLDEELEERRRTLEEIREVHAQEAAIRQQIK